MTKARQALIWTTLFAVIFLAGLLHRYRSSKNYGQIHVQVPLEISKRSDLVVLIRSKFGTLGTLIQSKDDPSLWSMIDTVPSVVSVILAASEKLDVDSKDLQIRAGENWGPPSWNLEIDSQSQSVNNAEALGLAFALEFVPRHLSQSWIPQQSTVKNWQGDQWLLLVPFFQSLMVIVLLYSLKTTWRTITSSLESLAIGNELSMQHHWWPVKSLLSMIYVSSIILVVHQLVDLWSSFLSIRWGNQFLVASSILVGVLAALYWYFRKIAKAKNVRARCFWVITFLMVVAGGKVIWVASIDSVQTADFRDYWNYGCSIAGGDWHAIKDPGYLLLPDIARRAYVYTFPIAKWIGPSLVSLELANVCLQLLTLGLFAWLVTRMFNLRIACFSLPFLVLYPDFWYAPTIAAHDTPGYFWLMLVWCLIEMLRMKITRAISQGLSSWRFLQITYLSALLGIAYAMLDMQRSFGPFVILAVILFVGFQGSGQRRSNPSRASEKLRVLALIFFSLLVAVTVSIPIKRIVQEEIGRNAGPFNKSRPLIAYITGVDSRTRATWNQIQPWADRYFPVVPEGRKDELSLRKIVHEKVASGCELWRCALRKNQGLGVVTFMMEEAFGGSKEHRYNSRYRVPWYSAQAWFCNSVYGLLLVIFCLRLICLRWMPITPSEVFPLCYTIGMYFTILGVTEMAFTYDEFMAFPLAWSAGLVLDRVLAGEPKDRVYVAGTRNRFSWRKQALAGVTGLAVLGGLHCLAGILVTHFGLAFATVRQIPCQPASRSELSPDVTVSAFHGAIRFPKSMAIIEVSDSVSAQFLIIPRIDARRPLAFFITGDQRASEIVEAPQWETVPVRYSVSIGQEILVSGPVSDLQVARLIELDPSKLPQDGSPFRITLNLESLGTFPNRFKYPPAVALEYPF